MPIRRLAAAVLLLVASAGPAAAAGDEASVTQKQVVAAIAAEARQALAGFRTQAASVAAELNGQLDGLEAAAAAGATAQQLAQQLVAALSEAQAQLADATVDAGSAVHGTAALALAELLDDELSYELPAVFVRGAGGPLDDFRRRLDEQVARTYARIGKRLRRTLGALEAQHGVALLAIVTPASALPHSAANIGSNASVAASPAIDVLVAASRPDTPGDGVLALSGRAGAFGGPVDVAATRFFTDLHEATLPAGLDERWTVVFAGVGEGNYLVFAARAGDAVHVSASIGVR